MATSPELLLISAMLRTKDHVLPAARGVTSEMFYGYREAFEWIEEYITQYRRTPSIGAFKDVFPDVYLKKVDDVEEFIERVREDHSAKVLREELLKVTNMLKNGDLENAIRAMNSGAIKAEASLLGHGSNGNIFEDFGDIKDEFLRRKKRVEDTGFAGIPTGFPTLDELTGGIQPGWFVLISARAGVGKTRNLIRMACAAAFSGYTVQYEALEQTRYEIATQVYTFANSEFGSGVMRSLELAQGKGPDARSYMKFLEDMRQTIKGNFHVADSMRGLIGPATMAAHIEQHKIDITFLDFLTLMPGADDWQSTANLSTTIKRMAQRYRIPIVTAAQINRNGATGKEQGLDTLAGTDRLGQDADLVINARKLSKSVIVMTVIKYRHGPEGQKFYLKFDPNMGVMEEITYEQAMDLRDKDGDNEEREREQKKFKPREKGSFHKAAEARGKTQSVQDAVPKAKRHTAGVRGSHRSDKRPVRVRVPR